MLTEHEFVSQCPTTHIIISNLKSSRSGCIIVILPSSREDDVLDVNSHTVVSEAIHWNGN